MSLVGREGTDGFTPDVNFPTREQILFFNLLRAVLAIQQQRSASATIDLDNYDCKTGDDSSNTVVEEYLFPNDFPVLDKYQQVWISPLSVERVIPVCRLDHLEVYFLAPGRFRITEVQGSEYSAVHKLRSVDHSAAGIIALYRGAIAHVVDDQYNVLLSRGTKTLLLVGAPVPEHTSTLADILARGIPSKTSLRFVLRILQSTAKDMDFHHSFCRFHGLGLSARAVQVSRGSDGHPTAKVDYATRPPPQQRAHFRAPQDHLDHDRSVVPLSDEDAKQRDVFYFGNLLQQVQELTVHLRCDHMTATKGHLHSLQAACFDQSVGSTSPFKRIASILTYLVSDKLGVWQSSVPNY